MQKGLVVVPHPAPVRKDNLFDAWTALLYRQKLVDLFLVLGDREAHLGVIEDEGHLLGDRILVDRHRHTAQSLGRGDCPIESRPVVADDRELVAAAKSHRRQPTGERFDLGGDLRPCPGLPDAVILFAVGRPVRPHPRMIEQELGKGIRLAQSHRCSQSASASLRSQRVPNRRRSTGQAGYSKERFSRAAAGRRMPARAALCRAGSVSRRWRGRIAWHHRSALRFPAART